MNPPKTRVLFVCIGNSCRSQMAEGFARHYGSDVIIPASAGLYPAMCVAHDTIAAMAEKNIDLRDHFPKSLKHVSRLRFDLVVNLSGEDLPSDSAAPVREWPVMDPIGQGFDVQCEVRDHIEVLVMDLILELRRRTQGGV